MDIEKIRSHLPTKDAAYYFGSTGFRLEAREAFDEAQVGYRAHPNGSDLTDNVEGDWQPTWYVIGRDTTVGDPFFVDVARDTLPVYTAMHGTGSWEPELVSGSLSGFLRSIEFLQNRSNQDGDLIDPDESTITDEEELEKIQKHILSLCGEGAAFFWECFFEQHQDWIAESEDWDD